MVSRRKHTPGSLKSWPESLVLFLEQYSGLSGLSVQQKALVQHPGTDTGSSGPH